MTNVLTVEDSLRLAAGSFKPAKVKGDPFPAKAKGVPFPYPSEDEL